MEKRKKGEKNWFWVVMNITLMVWEKMEICIGHVIKRIVKGELEMKETSTY